jgi:hypothetical protein
MKNKTYAQITVFLSKTQKTLQNQQNPTKSQPIKTTKTKHNQKGVESHT